jgi:hypothetical protein
MHIYGCALPNSQNEMLLAKVAEKIKTHFMLNNICFKSSVLWEMLKLWWSRTGDRRQYNTAHALCVLDN